jgi:hypothetical protein
MKDPLDFSGGKAMKNRLHFCLLFLFVLSLLQTSCFVPRYIWPQGDIQKDELNNPSLEKKVLVASRRSDFKDAVVEKIKEAFRGEPVYVKFIGIDELKKEAAGEYSAIVLISTCIAWKLDRHVNDFLNDQHDQSNVIVLTTSGDGDWLPKKNGRNYDAISSASQPARVADVADSIIEKIHTILDVE